MRRPVCALFAGALGAQLIAAFEPQAGFWPLAALFGFAGLVLAAGGRARGYGLWLLLGAALGLGFSVRTGAQFSALTERYDGRTVRLTATVEDLQEGYTRATVRARLRVETADGEAAAFCCQCDGLPLCEAGETIEGWFSLEAPAQADRPGRYADGVALLAGYERGFRRMGPGLGFRAWSARLQVRLSAALCQALDGDEAGALAAMIVGDRTRITPELNSAYRAAGLSHVLVVSGMHVTILCGVALPAWDRRRWLERGQQLAANLPGNLGASLHRRLGVRLIQLQLSEPRPARGGFHPALVWRRRLTALWPVVLAALLTGITGFTPSVLRAGAAVCIGALGVWLMAPSDPLTSLAVGGLAMSAFNSYAVCDIGFELSFAAVAGTLAGAELVRRRSARRASRDEEGRPRPLALRLASRLWGAVWEAGCITVCASAATFPVLVARGLSTSPYALLSGVAVLWLVQPMMVLGIAAALTGMVPALGPVYRACAWGAAFLVRLLNGWAEMVAAWPGAELAFDTGYAALVSLGLMGLCWLAFRWRVRARVWLPALALAAAVGVGAGVWLSRDVVQVELVGGARTPSVVLAQNGQTVVLYRGGSSGRSAVERWLARHGQEQAVLLVDLRMDPSRTNQPPARRVVTPGRFEPYTDYQTALGGIRLDMLRTSGGVGVRVTVDRWRLGAVSGEFELAGTAAVDWLLASPSSPAAFSWEDILALGRYDWMRADAPPAPARLWLRPGGGTKTR